MSTEQKPKVKFTRSITFKGMMIALMTFVMLIPGCMVQDLIKERQQTRDEAVRKIDAKWSYAQRISGPVLTVPFTQLSRDENNKMVTLEYQLSVTPDKLDIQAKLFPEERYYGIYKTILYKSTIVMTGEFAFDGVNPLSAGQTQNGKAYLRFGLSDLRGISEEIRFELNGQACEVVAMNKGDKLSSAVLMVNSDNIKFDKPLKFVCEIDLKGSGSINFLPVGKTTSVSVEGAWPNPGFIGNYTPEYTLDESGFKAEWKILHFNRNIPDSWIDNDISNGQELSFGVNLVDTVDIYQQNMRSAKYALMFIALTFVVFLFVEATSRKRIHPVQYLLVGVALILFYSLLLSISEPLGFGWGYLLSSLATIGLITVYASSIFKDRKQVAALALILSILYAFLYVILQLEDVALLVGSVGLFVILGIIMYFSRKIKWYNEEE